MLTREDMVRLHYDTNAAAGLRGSAARKTMCWAAEQLPGAEAWKAKDRLTLLLAEYARLITAARASVTAARAGAAYPLAFVEAELARHGGLADQDVTVPTVLADARTAMVLAGRAALPHEPCRTAA
jgi:hypothetical protein